MLGRLKALNPLSFITRRFKRGTVASGLVGASIDSDGVALTHITRTAEGSPELEFCEYVPCQHTDQRASVLAELVEQHQLGGANCNLVLRPQDYKLLLIEAPEVPDTEMASAVRWLIKDLVDFPVDSALIDTFYLPDLGTGAQRKMVYVVASKTQDTQVLIDMVRGSGLNLTSIDIIELALRNICALTAEDEIGQGMMYLHPRSSLLVVCRQEGLYLARAITLAIDSLFDKASDNGMSLSPDEQALDSLVLDVQRSLDYYESQLRQTAPANVLIAPTQHKATKLVEHLSANLTVKLKKIDLNELLTCKQELTLEMQAQCFAVIGAALREEGGENAAAS